MKRATLALLLALLAGSAFAQTNDAPWNIAASGDPAWRTDFNFIAPPP